MTGTFEQWWEDNKADWSSLDDETLAIVKAATNKSWRSARGEDKKAEPKPRNYKMEILYKLYYKKYSIVDFLGNCSKMSVDDAKSEAKVVGEKFMEQYKPSDIDFWEVRVKPVNI